ncbi:MAG TPA: rhodanese-like domain-containing protein, partial [Candidatus Eisenbacteria bacterium]|nr:rhodanese-like domain-containing protein [Candidatus Eisenbacteria bacterium]
MGRVLAIVAVAVVIAGGLAIALRHKPQIDSNDPPFSAADESRAAELLADKSRIWWQGHKLPMPAKHTLVFRAPDKMGTFPDPPAGCPVMPVEVARALAAGRARMSGDHPFRGRPVQLIDMRLRSLHLKEHISDSLNVPYNRMAEALKAGALKGLDPRTIVVLYGEVYPHFDATAVFRVEKFEAYYCLEGGLEAWKAKGYPVTV